MSAAIMTNNHDWRLFQVFMHPDARGIFHVEMDFAKAPDFEPEEFRCNCPVFLKAASCKHVDHVLVNISETPGSIVLLPVRHGDVTDEQVQEVTVAGGEAYHEFVLRHGVIEIL